MCSSRAAESVLKGSAGSGAYCSYSTSVRPHKRCLSPSLCSHKPLLPWPNPPFHLIYSHRQPSTPPTPLTIPKHGLSLVHNLNLNCSRANCSSSYSGLLLFFPTEGAFSVRGPQPGGEACGSVCVGLRQRKRRRGKTGWRRSAWRIGRSGT